VPPVETVTGGRDRTRNVDVAPDVAAPRLAAGNRESVVRRVGNALDIACHLADCGRGRAFGGDDRTDGDETDQEGSHDKQTG
jgi:hypothetical protein